MSGTHGNWAWGLGNTIAMAEKILINDGTMEQFKVQVKDTLERIEQQWLK